MLSFLWFMVIILASIGTIFFFEKHRKDQEMASLAITFVLGAATVVFTVLPFSLMYYLAPLAVLSIYGSIEAKGGAAWGKKLAQASSAFAMLLATCGILYMMMECEGKKDMQRAADASATLNHARSRVLGEYLAEKHRGETILVIHWADDPNYQEKIEALNLGLDGRLTVIEEKIALKEKEEASGEDQGVADPYFFDELDLQNFVARHKVHLVLSFAGLPMDWLRPLRAEKAYMRFPPNTLPKLVLLDSDVGELTPEQIKEGRVACALMPLPRADDDGEISGNYKAVFKKCFTLVDPASADIFFAPAADNAPAEKE